MLPAENRAVWRYSLCSGGHLRIERHVDHSQNAIHGSTKFMAHIGHEFALRAIGGFSSVLAGRKLGGSSLEPGVPTRQFVLLQRFFGLFQRL